MAFWGFFCFVFCLFFRFAFGNYTCEDRLEQIVYHLMVTKTLYLKEKKANINCVFKYESLYSTYCLLLTGRVLYHLCDANTYLFCVVFSFYATETSKQLISPVKL